MINLVQNIGFNSNATHTKRGESPIKLNFKNSESTKLLVNFVIHPKPASRGDVESSISFPYKQNPISKRKVSLAANPIG